MHEKAQRDLGETSIFVSLPLTSGSTKSSEAVSTGKTLFDAKLLVRLHDDALDEKLKSPHDWKIEKILLSMPNIK